MKYLILLLFVGCLGATVDERGITNTVYSSHFTSREDACSNLRNKFRIVCLKAGYKKYESLESYSMRALNYGNTYRCVGTAQCLDKEDK